MKPLQQTVIQPAAQTIFLRGIQQLADDVAVRADIHAVPVPAVIAGPQAEAVVMFGNQYKVFRARPLEQLYPLVRIKHFGFPHSGKIFITEVFTVYPFMEVVVGRVFLGDLPAIPFGIGQPCGFNLAAFWRVGGDGVQPPVNKDTELCVVIPFRQRAGVDAVPGFFV